MPDPDDSKLVEVFQTSKEEIIPILGRLPEGKKDYFSAHFMRQQNPDTLFLSSIQCNAGWRCMYEQMWSVQSNVANTIQGCRWEHKQGS